VSLIQPLLPEQILMAPQIPAIVPRVTRRLEIRVVADLVPAVSCNRPGVDREESPVEREESAQTLAVGRRRAGFPDSAAGALAGAPFSAGEYCQSPRPDSSREHR
jgi:hypothetical protein